MLNIEHNILKLQHICLNRWLTVFGAQNFSVSLKMSFKCMKVEISKERERERKEFMPGPGVQDHVASEASLNYECITIFMVFIRWWSEVEFSTDQIVNVSIMIKKNLMCIALPQAKFSSYYFSILKYATEENKISWFVSKIKYVDIRIFLLLLQVNAWHGRTIAERDETQFDLQETHSLLTGAILVPSLLPFTDVAIQYLFLTASNITSSKIQILQTKVAIINFSFGYFRHACLHEISHDVLYFIEIFLLLFCLHTNITLAGMG